MTALWMTSSINLGKNPNNRITPTRMILGIARENGTSGI
jgi:hypothetical protein